MSSETFEIISKLGQNGMFSAAAARDRGVHPSILAYYCRKGILERVSRGFYRFQDAVSSVPDEWNDVVLVAESIPQGVLCLVTALIYHELTDEFGREIWIAVPRESRPPKRPNTRVVRFSNMTLGVEKVQFGDTKVKIFDRERTVIDAFRYLGRETAIKTLKRYLRPNSNQKPDLKKLDRYSKSLRANITPYIESILS
jgi:predicted transcriptional regulator of viral defense system